MSITEQSYEQMVVLDSCVVIGILRSPQTAIKVLALFKGKHSRIVLQDIVFGEVHKVTGLSREETLQKISTILHKEVYVFATTDTMKAEAQTIERKYGICHFPDSMILAACKILSWTLLTFDHNMLKSADFEGILAFNPNRVRRF